VPIAVRLLKDYSVKVGTVVGFPHGSVSPENKIDICREAIYAGAQELDMVLNVAAMLDGDWDTVEEEISRAVELCQRNRVLLKVILETCYLKPRYIGYACSYAAKLGADFVKTSTGYGPGGATPEAVKIMREVVTDRCQVKASGGIKTYADAELYLDLGCTRLGSSKIEELLPPEGA
jgi:deoxyribose-phosphate aldolase